MFWLLSFVLLALGISFICSIAEAVLLSVTRAHIALLEEKEKPAGSLLRELKQDINKPLAAILTLNTIAHTVGAAGAGAQAATLFGSHVLGIVSALLTFLILVFSEIIPKTLGAHYWRSLSPSVAFFLNYLILVLYPFVKLSEWITSGIIGEPTLTGFSRNEIAALADISVAEGQLDNAEAKILKNMLLLKEAKVKSAMTPRTVLFSLNEKSTVEEYFYKYDQSAFSRIPIYNSLSDQVSGFVLRSDILLAQARGNSRKALIEYRRDLPVLLDNMNLYHAFEEMIRQHSQLQLVVDEYGGVQGLLTLEDVIETLLGLEIIDERDEQIDMQKEARKLWLKRAEKMGINTRLIEDVSTK